LNDNKVGTRVKKEYATERGVFVYEKRYWGLNNSHSPVELPEGKPLQKRKNFVGRSGQSRKGGHNKPGVLGTG